MVIIYIFYNYYINWNYNLFILELKWNVRWIGVVIIDGKLMKF